MVITTNDALEPGPESFDDRTRTCAHVVRQYFRRQPTAVATVDDLVPVVRDRVPGDVDEIEVAVHLHHVALPRLADTGCIEYDPRSHTARYREYPSVGE